MSRMIIGGVATIAALIAITLVAWPASAADTAYDDGKRIGEAVVEVQNAETYYEVDDALTEYREAVDQAQEHADDELDAQITEQGDNFASALNGFTGTVQASDEWDQDLYEWEADEATDAMVDDAEEFRSEAPEVGQSFVDGLKAGLGV